MMSIPGRETSTIDKLDLPPVFKRSILGNRHPCGKLNLEVKEGRVHVITGPFHGYIYKVAIWNIHMLWNTLLLLVFSC